MALSTLRDHQKQLRLNHLTFKISEIHMDSRQENSKVQKRKEDSVAASVIHGTIMQLLLHNTLIL